MTHTDARTADQKAMDDARRALQALILKTSTALAPDKTEKLARYEGDPCPETAPLPLAGLRAALLVKYLASGRVREFIDRARGAGSSWADIADVVGITEEPRDVGAFSYTLGPTEDGWGRFDRRYVCWKCRSCGKSVTDNGPYDSNPANNESGHAPDCERHQAEITEHRRRWESEQ